MSAYSDYETIDRKKNSKKDILIITVAKLKNFIRSQSYFMDY